MRHLQTAAVALLAIVFFAGTGAAQKKTAKKPPAKKTPPPAQRIVPPLEVRAAREKVEIQLSNVDRFVDVMGPIVQGIETLEVSAKAKKLPADSLAKHEARKEKLIAAIRNLKAGLLSLESEFRTKTSLQKYLTSIGGIADLASESEDSAIAGRFVASKDPLRAVSKKLTDTLGVMPL